MNVIASTDLWFPTQRDPVGPGHPDHYRIDPDPLRYVVWIDSGRWYRNGGITVGGHGGGGTPRGLPELAPRTAFHLVACRNGGRS